MHAAHERRERDLLARRRRDLLTPEAVDALHRSVPHVMTWPVDTAAELADAKRLGVTGIIGKDLGLLTS